MTMHYLKRQGKPSLAYVYSKGNNGFPAMFCGGYASDMNGTKATYFESQCRARGQAFIRFDYSGHGKSEGDFEEGTISRWKDDALAVLEHLNVGPVVLIGSSMGGWVSLLIAKERPELVRALIGIAAAPDFSEDLYHHGFTEEERKAIDETGRVEQPNDYGDPYVFTLNFIKDGRNNLLLDKSYKFEFPVTLFQGKLDPDVPWETALKIKKAVSDTNVVFIEDGDHRLSRDTDLALIDLEIKKLSGAH